jgi:hypothetical protein
MFSRKTLVFAVVVAAGLLCAYAADITGKWTAQFDSQVGVQKYTYDFKVEGTKLTGTALANIDGNESKAAIQDGKIDGDEISFVEMQNYQGQEIRIVYKGKVSGDEIKFTRNVADTATEEFAAKRAR